MVHLPILIAEYNGIEQKLVLSQNYEKQKEDIDRQVASTSLEISRGQTLLNQTQKDLSDMQTRVHRNENPRFLHYFVRNREAKVERLKAESKQLKIIEQDLSSKLSIASAQLLGLQQKQQDVHIIVDRKHQMEERSRQLFNQAVAGQAPTQTLQHLRIGRQEQSSALASEQMLLQAVDTSVQQVKQGLSLFQKAEGLYQQARCMNERAKNAKRKMRNESAGYKENAEMKLQRLERQKRHLQCRRDKAINQANSVAIRAYQVTSTGFATFPTEARARYPKLGASIGEVAFPRLQGENFTGTLVADTVLSTVGAAMNDAASGCWIQENVQVAGQCASISSQQFWLMTQVQNAVATNGRQLKANLKNIKQNIVAEHRHTFNGKRSTAWWSSLQQHWFSGPRDHHELLFKRFRDSIACMSDAYIRMMKENKRSAVMASPRYAVLDLCVIC